MRGGGLRGGAATGGGEAGFQPTFVLVGDVGGRSRRYLLHEGVNRVGSLASNEVFLESHGVSRRHAVLEVDGERLSIADLSSKNGTFRNGGRVASSHVRPGDVLGFGPASLRLEPANGSERELAVALTPCADSTPSHAGEETVETPSTVGQAAADMHPYERPASRFTPRLVFPEGFVRGDSPAMTALFSEMQPLALSELPVVISGETGVGKEWIARILHASSERRGGPFVALNCAAVPGDLLEAEFFGIDKGVATGVAGRKGKFELAQGGTLFLDEIADMSRELQAKLLRALQEKVIHPVGSSEAVRLDVRLLAATNSDLEERMDSGALRRDLYYRLAGFVLEVPPLRERREDFPHLVEHFLRSAATAAHKVIRGMTAGTLERLTERPWPGNVRELEHEVRRLVCGCPSHQVIDSSMLSQPPRRSPAGMAEEGQLSGFDRKEKPSGLAEVTALDQLDLATIEKHVIEEALRRAGGNRTRAARLLGLSRGALRRRLARLQDAT